MRKIFFCLFLACVPLFADDDRFLERYADPKTRTAALAELIPGTREAYFHTALDHQLSGRDAEFDKILAAWKAASDRKENPVSSEGFTILENRHLLINYQNEPQAALAELIKRLGLEFDQTRPDAAAAAAGLPTRIDPALISEAEFEKAASQESKQAPYKKFEGKRRLRELERVESFDEAQIRWFMENIDRADLPGVVPLVDRALGFDQTLSFLKHDLLKQLTAGQLESLLEVRPDLRSKESFCLAYLAKLKPGAETDFDRDLAAHAAHLKRCRDFVLQLPPGLNSLKAHVLFHHLRLQVELGNFPKEDFLKFLALPRQNHPLVNVRKAAGDSLVRLDSDFKSATGCMPVRDDLPLILTYLNQLLGKTDSMAEFTPFLDEKKLAVIHARARLLAGENPARWGVMLDPADFKSLLEETRIGFAPGAPKEMDADAEVALVIDLKNTPDLLIRIYELDLPAHLARGSSEPNVAIDLDGLVPHHERRLAFPQTPMVQHRETIMLPELSGPGAWLVDFVSGQVSARALVRKGGLVTFVERGANGQSVRVFDEKGRAVREALILLGNETFNAVEGRILVPNSANQPVTQGIVRAGKLAVPISLGSREDEIALDTRFHLEREQLLADQEARLHLRVRLTNHGHELSLDRIQEPALNLKAELLGGITTERVIAENLELKPVMGIPFQVPADLLKLTLTLRGTVIPATGGDPLKLNAEWTYEINGDLKTARVGTSFFSATRDGHRLELRGRNGEPMPSRAITLKCSRFDFGSRIELQVRTDEKGRVDLGTLESIDYLTATGTDTEETLYGPKTRLLDYTGRLHLSAGVPIRLPLAKPAAVVDRLVFSLLETLGDEPIRDHFDKLTLADGEIVIQGLPPGDFVLKQGDETTVIRISSAPLTGDLLISATRILPGFSPLNPTITRATAEDGKLKIQLRDFGPGTRVSIMGLRHQYDDWNPGAGLYPFARPLPDTLQRGFIGNGFLTERRLSDETRYILDRRAATRFPGAMLPRPSQLLNRWTEEDIGQHVLPALDGAEGSAKQGKAFGSLGGAIGPLVRGEDGDSKLATVCDFLSMPAVVRFDLTPGADGSLTVPLAEFEGSQFLKIAVTDDAASDEIQLALPPSETPLRDRRIARPLDPNSHFVATRSAAVLAKGAEAKIENLLDADWRAFTTLTEAHKFLYGMTGDDRLREFVFLTEWPDLKDEKKLELLEKHACHELHLFLARKDKSFFEKHIKPRLPGKSEPRFIDDLLLDRDLSGYLRPFAWQRLNAAEKALLAQAMPAARERIKRELAQRWVTEAPAPDQETSLFTQTLRGIDLTLEDSLGLARNDLQSSGQDAEMAGASYLNEKLRSIIIPQIDFEDTTLDEAIDFLRLRAKELDTIELDPSRKGINFVIRRPRGGAGQDPGSLRIKEFRLQNVPLSIALKYIAEQTKMRYKLDDFAVTLVPLTEAGEDLMTRTYRVPPDFAASLDGSGGADGGNADPFAEPSPGARLSARKPISELLKSAGIILPPGASATLAANGTLLVTSTASELDKVAQLTQTLGSSPPSSMPQMAEGFADSGAGLDPEGVLPPPDDSAMDPFADSGANQATALKAPSRLSNFPERTRLWREANYYQSTQATDESLVPLNRFWLDLAAWDGKGAFLSPHFNACHTNANEALLCLALLDLPFKAERPEVNVDGSTLRVKAREPMLLFYKDTRRTENVAAESPLLVRQSFSPQSETFRQVDGRQIENVVTGDFRPGVAYGASLVVTNPTGVGRRIDVLAQIPAGAIPLYGRPTTLSSTHELNPYGVLMLDLTFYFPAAGDFAVYPLHVSEGGTVLASTAARSLRVSNDPAPQDAASWLVLAKEGTDDEVIARLRTENLKSIDLFAIRWRLKDRGFFEQVSGILRERLHFSEAVTAFGFLHNDGAALRDYFENSEVVNQVGKWLDTPLLEVLPQVHHDWATLEFDPLVNPRSHRFGDESRLTHEAAKEHYRAFLKQLGWKAKLDASDHLTLAAFLFLQDRIEEALERFGQVDPEQLRGRTNYDYLHAVVFFYQARPVDAQAIAAKVLPTLPPGVWRERFQTVIDQAAEIAALAQAPEKAKPAAETTAPELALALAADGRLVIEHRALESASLQLFSVDLEVLFSKDPFLSGDGKGLPAIRANETLEVTLAKDQRETTVELPEGLRKGNVLVSAKSGSRKLLKILDSRALEIRQMPLERTIQVVDSATAKPLVRSYVKVYAESRSGEVAFHKDGYTDLRGKFDYLSHTGVDSSTIKRVAILVSDPEKGARTVIYEP